MNKKEALKQQLAILESERKELEIQIQKLNEIINRPEKTKEDRFWELILQTNSIKIDKDKYPDSTFGFIDDIFLWEYNKNRIIYLSFSKIWSILGREFDLNYDDIQQLVKEQIEEHFKLKEITPKINTTIRDD